MSIAHPTVSNESPVTEVSGKFEAANRPMSEVIGHIVSLLHTSLDCQWVVFVGTSDLRSRMDCACEDRNTIFSAGQREADDATLVRLIARFGNQAMSQPFVCNDLQGEQFNGDFNGVQQFILGRVFKYHQHWGWLLAANRHANRGGVASGQKSIDSEFGRNELSTIKSAAVILAAHAHNMQIIQQKQDLVVNVVRTLVTTIEAKDHYTRGHSERVAKYGRLLARQLGLGKAVMDRIYMSGLLHDIGKIGVPDATLSKIGELTREEFEQIKQHPELGWQMLQGLDPLKEVLPGLLHHHERVDGAGYPDGLMEDEIPIDGRILAVADAYDAMTSHRSYRESLSQEQAEEVLRDGAGIQWDAKVIEALFAIMPEVIKIRQSYRKQSTAGGRRSKRRSSKSRAGIR